MNDNDNANEQKPALKSVQIIGRHDRPGVRLIVDGVDLSHRCKRYELVHNAGNEPPILRLELLVGSGTNWEIDARMQVVADVMRFDRERESIAERFMHDIASVLAKYTARLFER